jgi:hypothetical protein
MDIKIRQFDEKLFNKHNFLIICEDNQKKLQLSIIKHCSIDGQIMVKRDKYEYYSKLNNDPYKDHIVYNQYNDEILDGMIGIDEPSYLILDYTTFTDIDTNPNLFTPNNISPLILSMRYLVEIKPSTLKFFDYIIIKNIGNVRRLDIFNLCSDAFESFITFNEILDDLTLDFYSLIIDMQVASKDRIFWYKP